ncbi:MAG: porphobilinogen synthase [Sediminibacterium sp.]|uniref:porphobilinogen synthase n=1 Tax=Sediminibacterium sp. TaxID=1917865 RepID=UPI00271DEAD9|nr:porphobilinogen synthase [Sediminibacterium sp.]MDO8997997.1 porphobilinogen synthase [Sediminibacterium sp.]
MQLIKRNRILRKSAAIRSMVAETQLTANNFIVPLFIVDGVDIISPIESMVGYNRYSINNVVQEVKLLWQLGIKSVLIFVKSPDELKDNTGKEAWNPEGLMQKSIKAIKDAVPEMIVMTDVALDPYSSYGHDGIIVNGDVANDLTVDALVKMGLSHAAAGADFLAPSDMMDGRIGAIRNALEENNFKSTGIMSYSAKYASCFYGPFRDALDSAPGMGDKKSYQMNYTNRLEAINETLQDIEQGADIVMVKPAMAYLDIIREVKNQVTVPVSAYQVSGEYAMIKAAAAKGWLNEDLAILESLFAIKRAGADLIATYFAKDAIRLLNQ